MLGGLMEPIGAFFEQGGYVMPPLVLGAVLLWYALGYRMFALRAWYCSYILTDDTSSHSFMPIAYTSMSYVFADANVMSPVQSNMIRYGSPSNLTAFSASDRSFSNSSYPCSGVVHFTISTLSN